MHVFGVNRRAAEMFRAMLAGRCEFVSFGDVLRNTVSEHEMIKWFMFEFFLCNEPSRVECLQHFLRTRPASEMVNDVIRIEHEFTTLLISSMQHSHQCNATRMLLDAGCDVNQCNGHGETALHLAVALQCLPCTELICAHMCKIQADMNTATNNGTTALHIAVKYGSSEITELLLHSQADPNATDDNLQNCLHYMARYPNDSVRSILLAAVDESTWQARDNWGHTPVQHSVRLLDYYT